MMRLFAFLAFALMSTPLLADDKLPKDPVESFDIEPPLLIQEIPERISSGKSVGETNPEKEIDPERIRVSLEKARKNAVAGERLYKSGVLAKVEAENRALKVIRLEANLAAAQLESAQQNTASQQSRFDAHEISATELAAAKSSLAVATAEAQTFADRKTRAELDAALLNLHRQKKLLAMGSGRKSEVARAEEKVTALQQAKN